MDALRRLLRAAQEHLAALERAATAPPSRARDTRALSTAAAAHAAAAEGPHRAAAPEFIAIAGLVRSPLGEALFLLLAGLSAGALALLARWSPRVWCAFARARAEAFADADFVLVVGPDGTASEIPVVRAQAFVAFAGGKRLESVRYFEYRKLRYVYSPRFASFQRQSPRLDESFADVHAMRAGRSADEAAVLLLANGPNSIDVGATPLSNLVADKLLHPFYVFQIASVAIWIAESYTSYALLILLLSTASAAWEVAEAVRNEAHLRSMAASAPVAYPVLRDGALLNLGPAELVVGDAVVLSAAMDSLIGHHVACDLLLVQGECVMDEAALTGESVPVVKLPLPYTDNDATDEDLDDNNVPRDAHTRWPSHAQAGDGNDNGDGGDVPQGPRSAASAKRSFIDPDRHKKHILFSGSKFVELKPRRSWGFAPSAASGNDLDPEMVVAVVLATGFSSSKGELVRSILFPAHVELKFNVDAYKFLAALGAVAAAAFLNRFVTACRSGTPWFLALVSSLDLITIAVPPALPLVLTVGTGLALERLRRSQVFCIAPARINYAGRIDVMCWDKTGTLTVPKLAFCGVDPGGNGILQQAAHPADAGRDATAKGLAAAPPSVETCMAVCHGVVLDESGTELGNPVDVEMLRASRWRIDPSPPPAAFTDAGVPVVCTVSPASDPLPTSDPMHFGPASVTPSASAISSIHTLRRFEFDPHVQRTSVIVCAAPSPAAAPWRIYTKGSPEAILHVCRPQSIPSDYFAVCQQLSVQGLYVLACASREVEPGEFPSCSAPQAPSLSSLPPGDVSAGPAAALARCRRERVENNLVFLGFVAFENPIRPEAFETISELREAMVRSVIITGDNALTAVHVGRALGLCDTTLLVDMHEGTVQFSEIPSEMDMPSPAVFQKTPSNNTLAVPQHTAHGNRHGHHHRRPSSGARVVDDSLTSLGTRHHSHIDDLIHSLSAMPPQTELAVTGEALAALCARDDLDFVDWLVGRARVFSRVKPDQKTWIVERLVRHGKYVGMCGDGTNDCGALKAAHVGVALSDAEASIVAPFTSARKCVSDVPYLVREGRCALETSFIAFKYMTLYPIIQLTMSATLNQHGVAMSNNQFFFDDMFVVTMLALAMLYTRPADTLGRERPTDDLFSPVVLVSIAGQVVVAIAFFAINVAVTVAQPWFCSADEATAGLDPMFRPLNASAGVDSFPCYPIDPHTDTSQDLLVKSFENTSIWLYSHFMFAVVAAAVSLTTHFCRPVWTNVFFTAYLGAITAVLLALLLLVVNESSARMPGPEEYADAVSWLFSIQPGVPPLFRLAQAGLLLAYTACAVLWETRVVDVYVRRAAAEAEALKIRMLDAKREAAVGIVNAQTAAAVGRSSRVSRSSDPPGADAADGDDYAEDAGLLAPAERVRLRPIRPAPSASPAGDKYASIDVCE